MRFVQFLLLAPLAACAGSAHRATPASPPSPAQPTTPNQGAHATPALPPVPLVDGPLAPKVVYPTAGAVIASRDSNFIFGSVGNGRASLTINGLPVPVWPNGSFLAYLALPPRDAPRYELVAVLGKDTARVVQPVTLLPPRPVLSDTGRLVVDSASAAPTGGQFLLHPDEPVRVSVRAPANASVWVQWDSAVAVTPAGATPPARSHAGGTQLVAAQPVGTPAAMQLLVNGAARPGLPLGRSSADNVPVRYLGDSTWWATDLPARALDGHANLIVARGRDTVRFHLAQVSLLGDAPTWALLGADSSTVSDTDRVVVGRPTPGGTYKWFLFPGTQVQLTGREGSFARVRLDSRLEIWVRDTDVRVLPQGYPAPRRLSGNPDPRSAAGNARLVPAAQWVDLVIPVGDRPPFLVQEDGDDLVLTLYGVQSATDIVQYMANDSLVRSVRWEQVASDRVRYTVHLASAPFGYLPLWRDGSFVLRIRRPPKVNRDHPLAGLTIAVDPGHPPIGATGPTGLWEPVATLAIGQRVKAQLEARGARVLMTRTTDAPVALGDRPIMARQANVDALVSIHLNALPDGINPFTAQGSGTYFFRQQSEPLARAVQQGMVASMGLPNLGVYYDNLALARPTWMPAILCEGAFIIMPAQEAALRTPEFQEAYARGVAQGLETFFRTLAK
ncbi:MAG TPA: N-acetylmuramoyl-L-alanine amidase [Gemmatimonadaceae bacterium]